MKVELNDKHNKQNRSNGRSKDKGKRTDRSTLQLWRPIGPHILSVGFPFTWTSVNRCIGVVFQKTTHNAIENAVKWQPISSILSWCYSFWRALVFIRISFSLAKSVTREEHKPRHDKSIVRVVFDNTLDDFSQPSVREKQSRISQVWCTRWTTMCLAVYSMTVTETLWWPDQLFIRSSLVGVEKQLASVFAGLTQERVSSLPFHERNCHWNVSLRKLQILAKTPPFSRVSLSKLLSTLHETKTKHIQCQR